MTVGKQAWDLTIGQVDLSFLLAVNSFRYLTAEQYNRLLYPRNRDGNRYVQRRTKRLADAGYLQRLEGLPKPAHGTAPTVFTLGGQGRKLLRKEGITVASYYRPSEEPEKVGNPWFMPIPWLLSMSWSQLTD